MCYGDIERIVLLVKVSDSYLQEGAPGWELKAVQEGIRKS